MTIHIEVDDFVVIKTFFQEDENFIMLHSLNGGFHKIFAHADIISVLINNNRKRLNEEE